MKKTIQILFFLSVQILWSQDNPIVQDTLKSPIDSISKIEQDVLSIFQYPKGIYLTKYDFESKTPNFTTNLITSVNDSQIAYRFEHADSGDKIKDAFAISDEENLYINIHSIIENFDQNAKGQSFDGGKYYLKVHFIGKHMFMSDYFSSNAAAIFGGLSGAMATRREKGILYFPQTRKFHLFKNYEEFEDYIKNNYPEKVFLLEKYTNPKIAEIIKIKSILEQVDLP